MAKFLEGENTSVSGRKARQMLKSTANFKALHVAYTQGKRLSEHSIARKMSN